MGRDADLRALRSVVESAPSVALVEGEAGIGKTRLLQELLAAGPAQRVLIGRCYPVSEPFALGPIVEALLVLGPDLPALPLTPLAGALHGLIAEHADVLPPPLPALDDRTADRHRLFRAIREVLDAAGPTLLVLEDVHWADDATGEFLRFLLAAPPSSLSIVATVRVEDLDPAAPVANVLSRLPREVTHRRIALAPLDADGVAELANHLLGQQLSGPVVQRLLHTTGGLPFAVEECARLLHEQGTVDEDAVIVPDAVRASVGERLASLDSIARCVVEAAAVLGTHAGAPLLAAVARLDEAQVDDGVTQALQRMLLEEANPGTYRFRHALARQAVYDAIPVSRRRRLHEAGAQVLRDAHMPPLAQVALHLRQAHGPSAEWVKAAEVAAEGATAQGEHRTALRLLRDALEHADDDDTRVRLAVAYAQEAVHCRVHEEAIPQIEAVFDDGPASRPRSAAGQLSFVLGRLLFQAGRPAEGAARMRQAIDGLDDEPALAAEAMRYLAFPRTADGTVGEHVAWLRRATAAAERSGDARVQLSQRVDEASVLTAFGNPQGWEVADTTDFPDDAHGRQERMRMALNVAYSGVLSGHYGRTAQWQNTVRALSKRHGYERFLPVVEGLAALLAWATGDWRSFTARLPAALCAASASPSATLEIRLVDGLINASHGDIRDAEPALCQLCADATAAGVFAVALTARGTLARLAQARGDANGAVDVTAPAVELLRAKQVWAWGGDVVPWAVSALRAADQGPAAASLAREFAAGVATLDAPFPVAAVPFVLGLAETDAAKATAHLLDASQAFATLPRPYEAALALEAAGSLVMVADASGGATLLRQAKASFAELGATWDSDRVAGTLRAHGQSPAHRRGRRGYGTDLSPREAEVVRLVAAGATNREVGEALFLSPRTVERHVANAMRKLGVSTRDDFAAALADSLRVPTA